jgi:mycothiol synthase
METSFTIRHYVPEKDISHLSQMLTEIESMDRDGEDTSEEYLRSMNEWTNFDPDQNVWVGELDVNFVGYGQVLPKNDGISSIYVVVHHTQRRKGLGSRLLELVLNRAREANSKAVLAYANGRNRASVAFLHRHGFDAAGTSGVMVAQIRELPRVELPPGFSLRRYSELGDPQIVVRALNECYRDMVGHHQNVTSADRFISYYGEEGIHLLFDKNDSLIGICAAKPQGKSDERGVSDLLDAPGIVREHRHAGFQKPLALAVMSWLREKGTYPVTLEYWGDDERSLNLYRDLGFELVQQQITYRRELE